MYHKISQKTVKFWCLNCLFFSAKLQKVAQELKKLDISTPTHCASDKNNFWILHLVKFSGWSSIFLNSDSLIIFSFPISLLGYMRRGLISGS